MPLIRVSTDEPENADQFQAKSVPALPIILKFKLVTEASGAVNATLTKVLFSVLRVAFCSKSALPYVIPPYVIDNVKPLAVPN